MTAAEKRGRDLIVTDLPGPLANGDSLTITWDTDGNVSAHRTIPGEVVEKTPAIEPGDPGCCDQPPERHPEGCDLEPA